MKTIGMIGGMTWESSVLYYQAINREVRHRLGSLANARSLMATINFEEVVAMQKEGRWDDAADLLVKAAKQLELGGADCILVCTNTMHKVAPEIQGAVNLPFLHIADSTGMAIKKSGLKKVGLLASKYSMTEDFLTSVWQEKFDLDVIVPSQPDMEEVHRIIYEELGAGIISDSSRKTYQRIIAALGERCAEGVILGCTEIPMLISQEDSPLPVFDSTALHAFAAVDFALGVK